MIGIGKHQSKEIGPADVQRMKVRIPRHHFDGIGSADKAVGRIAISLLNVKTQSALLDANGRQSPWLGLGCIHVPEKYHRVAYASASRIDDRPIRIRLNLPFGQGIAADWIGAN